MKTYKKKLVETVDHILCDVCGKTCTDDLYNDHENATIEAVWGYNSRSDGDKYEIHLCENCFYITISFLRNQRSQHIPAPKNDPFNGSKYI